MKPHTLPKASLLRKPWEYKKVYRTGKRVQGGNFSLIYAPSDTGENRLGVSIHGRLKGTVRRNRIKRIIKEFYRANRGNMSPAKDIIFVVRKGFALKNPAEIEMAVNSLHKEMNECIFCGQQ